MTDLVLITGCSGFVASWITKQALDAGFRVRGTVRDPTNEKRTKHVRELPGASERLELVALDLEKSDDSAFEKAVEGCTFVLHTASPTALKLPKDDNEIIRPAVNGTLGVLKAALKSSTVKRVVVTSSIAAMVTTKKKDGEAIDESDWTDVKDPGHNSYIRSKALAEKAAWDFVKEKNPSWTFCTINPSFILGPSITPETSPSIDLGSKFLNREIPMVPAMSLNSVDVRDVARAHIKTLQVSAEAVNGHRFILDGKTFWMREIAMEFNRLFGAMGYKVPTTKAPYFVIWLLSFFDGTMKFMLPLLNRIIIFDNKSSKDILGIEYMNPEKTLLDYGHSLIYFGHVRKLKGYKLPSPDWTPANA